MVIPYGITGEGYEATRLNPFEGQYATYGYTAGRFKGKQIYETAMTQEIYEEELEAWEAVMNSKADDPEPDTPVEPDVPAKPETPSIVNKEYGTDYVSLYSEFGKDVTIADVIEDEDSGAAYIERDGVRYTLGMDFLSRAMVYNTTVPKGGDWETEDDVYADWWRLYITRWNELLPEVPLYTNKYYDLYNAQIKGVEEHPTNPFWAPAAALIDWTSETDTIRLGSTTELSGKFRYATFGANSPGSADLDIQNLIVGLETVSATKDGSYTWNPTVVEEHTETNNKDGSRTYTIKIHEDLLFSDGSPVTAKNYLVNVLTFSTPVAAQAANKDHMAGMTYVGFEEFNAYTGSGSEAGTKEFSGIRLIDEYTFSVTVAADYLPYFYAISYCGFSAVPTALYLGDCDILDDGNGVYLSDEFYAKDGDSYIMAGYIEEGAWNKDDTFPYSGPYTIEEWKRSSKSVVLAANPYFKGNYEGAKPGIQNVIYKKLVYETRIEELLAGELDVLVNLSSGDEIDQIIDLADNSNGKFVYTCYNRAGYGKLAFRADFGPVQFAEVRKAIAYCMDRVQYANDFTGGYGSVINGPYYDTSWAYKAAIADGMKLNAYETSLDNAIAVLEEGGWVYNADGSAYSGSGVRYKKIKDTEMQEADKTFQSKDGTYKSVQIGDNWYMPLALNWFGTSDNYQTDLLISGFMNNENIVNAGFIVQNTVGEFAPMLDELYQAAVYGYYGGIPTYTCFNFSTGFPSAAYDYSYNWTIDPAEYDNYSICYLKDQADVYWLK